MEKDIVPGLLELIEKEFDEKTFNSDVLKKAIQALKNKKATYKDANEFAIEIGEILSEVLNTHITLETLPNGQVYFNIADRILNSTMQKNFDLITGYAIDVQTELNNVAGLKLKGQKPKLNQSRIDGIIERLSTEEFEEIKWILDEPIKNFSQSIVDDVVKANVEFQAKTGLRPKIVRKSSGKCCNWCEEIAGTYSYPDVPKDVYRRHRFCNCTVDFVPGDGKIKNVHTKEWRDPERESKIEARKKIGLEQDKKIPNKVIEEVRKDPVEITKVTEVKKIDATEIKLDKTETKIVKMQRELEESKAQTQAMKKELINAYMEKKDMTLEEATIEADKVEARARAKVRAKTK